MQAERIILETDAAGRFEHLPAFPPRTRIEAIFLILETNTVAPSRIPPLALKTRTRICGDLIQPAIDENEWALLK